MPARRPGRCEDRLARTSLGKVRRGHDGQAKPKPLGRRAPTDWRHYEKFPLTAATTPTTPTPVAIGVNWYEDFDTPVQKGSRSWIGLDSKQLGKVRGGHCVCLEPGDQLNGNRRGRPPAAGQPELVGLLRPGPRGRVRRLRVLAHDEPAQSQALRRPLVVGLGQVDRRVARDEPRRRPGHERARGLRDPARARPRAWKQTFKGRSYKQRDKEEPVGRRGHRRLPLGQDRRRGPQVLKSPANDAAGAVRILNSWGRGYPHRVWMPDETLQRLIDEDGEVALVTDR